MADFDIPLGRPPFRPRARADFNPACVRSRINSRSNWVELQKRGYAVASYERDGGRLTEIDHQR
jgi:hypothetical protein